MWSYIKHFVNYVFGMVDEEADNELLNQFIEEQISNLEKVTDVSDLVDTTNEVPVDKCFERTGIVTNVESSCILIDSIYYFDCEIGSHMYQVNDQVTFLAYRDQQEGNTKVVRILKHNGPAWGDVDANVKQFDIIDHSIVVQVIDRVGRDVILKDTDLKFNLNEVEIMFVPVKGDWLELACSVQWDDENSTGITAEKVLQVIAAKALRKIAKKAKVTYYNSVYGICDSDIYFDIQSMNSSGFIPQMGSMVLLEAIESDQGSCHWRAIQVEMDQSADNQNILNKNKSEEENTLELEQTKGIQITYPIFFKDIDISERSTLTINIINNSTSVHHITKWNVLKKRADSQIDIKPIIVRPVKLFPRQEFQFTVTCIPKFLGSAREELLLFFRGFVVKRWIDITITNKHLQSLHNNNKIKQNMVNNNRDPIKMDMFNVKNQPYVPGVKVWKQPNFIPVKLGAFNIPDKLFKAFVTISAVEQNFYSITDDALSTIEKNVPCLLSELNIQNYTDRWHNLLFLEEIEEIIKLRNYDLPKTFLNKCNEYISLEVKGLSEKKPSLLAGHSVIVTDIWDSNKTKYEGVIHIVRGENILMKFHPRFHDVYTGYDVSVQFMCTRGGYRKRHQAINLAITHLGQNLLFPMKVDCKSEQVSAESQTSITWYNRSLNANQKAAVHNILSGVCRPLPYLIYGPPGTGKTITLVEIILQLTKLLPSSRILVATPSNSAANLITERLVKFKDILDITIIRLIANYLVDSEEISDIIRPFCATIDIARDNTAQSKQTVSNGIGLNCRSSYIARHRIIIGTCGYLGTLAQTEISRGHFTHVIVDEAGQTTEPEIMIPLTFIDKTSGQIIIAGDPMQLGPYVLSKYAEEYGMGETYMSRLLKTLPYQRDPYAFKDGFDKRLVTRLTDNYRSVQNVISLPSKLFYDNSLVPRIDINQSWVQKILDDVSYVFLNDKKDGGIFMFGLKGENYRAEESPSWFNPQEAMMILMSTSKLYKRNVSPDEIGIISPYLAQVKYLRNLFISSGAPLPKIGTVEEFQGQERAIILISMVRSSAEYLKHDMNFSLGFIHHPKRVNVAITRAHVAAVIFCNPHILVNNPLWNNIIEYTLKNNTYIGCDLPQSILKSQSLDNKE